MFGSSSPIPGYNGPGLDYTRRSHLLKILQSHVDDMVAHALEEYPNECCGLLAGVDGVGKRLYRTTNIVRSPVRYQIDPREQLAAEIDAEKNGWEYLAFYHSHTRGHVGLSTTDVRMALDSGWLDVYYLLVLLHRTDEPRLNAYRVSEDGQVVEVPFEVI